MEGSTARAGILGRIVATGRPFTDPACAGCPQLVTLRALRRAGLDVQGGLACDPEPSARPLRPGPGHRAALVGGLRLAEEGARALLEEAARAGASLVVGADDRPARAPLLRAALLAAGARVAEADTASPLACELQVADALGAPGTVLLSVAPCTAGGPRHPAPDVLASRCNRCGACLSLGCPALLDAGGEAMVVDAAVCTGCAACLPLCRARALAVRRG